MKQITECIELNEKKHALCLATNAKKEIVANKSEIVNYLKSFNSDCVSAGRVFDSVIDEYTDITDEAFDDGEFCWSSTDIYYFDKYDIKLNSDFIKKVIAHG